MRDPRSCRPVLLLHGQPGRPRDWDRVVAAIGSEVRTLVIRRPGWERGSRPLGLEGNSAAAVGALDRAQVERAVVVGHSLGAAVAAWLAASRPERVQALILVAPAANAGSLTRLDRLLAAPVLGDLLSAASLAAAGSAVSARPLRRALARGLDVDPAYLRSAGGLLLDRHAWRSFVAEQRMLIRELPWLEARLADIIAPTTIVVGTADRIVPIASARALAEQIRGSRLIELRGAHHLVHQQRARELAQIIVGAASS